MGAVDTLRSKTPIRLEFRESDSLMKVYFSGHMTPDLIREKEETLLRAVDKCSAMGLIFEENCETSSALVGLIMRLDKATKSQHKALRLKVLSPRVMALLKSLNLINVLKLI